MIVILPNKGGSAEADRLEFAGLLRQRAFGRKPLHRRGAEEAMTIGRTHEKRFGTFSHDYRSATHEHHDALVVPQLRRSRFSRQRRALVELAARDSTSRLSHGESDMTVHHLRSGLHYRLCLFGT